MIRVVIVDDQAMVRSGLRSLLEGEPDLQVVGEASDGQSGVSLVRSQRPDVVLMDVRMPILDGIAATRLIGSEGLASRVLILTTFDLDEYVFQALRAGASGLLLKDATAEQLVSAVRTVAAGDALLDPAVTQRVIDAYVETPPAAPPGGSELADLTARELDVLRLVAHGRSNREIAATLFIGEATAKTHVSNVLAKLGLRDRVQAVIHAYESGLVRPGQKG